MGFSIRNAALQKLGRAVSERVHERIDVERLRVRPDVEQAVAAWRSRCRAASRIRFCHLLGCRAVNIVLMVPPMQ